MQISQVAQIENKNQSSIHLIQDALFFRAWEKSAWLFCQSFREYKINCRFYKNIQKELIWLGFPRTILQKYLDDAKSKGWEVEQISESHYHIQVSGTHPSADYKTWRDKKLLRKHDAEKEINNKIPEPVLVGFRLCYDLALDLYRMSGRLNRYYRFSLGEKLRHNASELAEFFHLLANGTSPEMEKNQIVQNTYHTIRLELRMLKDLQQIKEKRWIQLNNNLDSVALQIDILQKSLIRSSAN